MDLKLIFTLGISIFLYDRFLRFVYWYDAAVVVVVVVVVVC